MYYQHLIVKISFREWILNGNNRLLLFASLFAALIQFTIFKILYPFPNFLPDSYSYLLSAATNQDINQWPIGYSKLLRFFSSITHSDTALIFVQYISLQAATIYLIFTISYLMDTGKWPLRIMLLIGVLNPLWLYVSNLISADAIFASLSVLWFTQLIWIQNKITFRSLLWHSLTLFLAFIFRFNAVYYPIISIIFILSTNSSLRLRLAGITIILLSISSFLLHNYYQYKKLTNTKQIAAFGGWQLAANALYAYAHIPENERLPIPQKFKSLHSVVNRHIDSLSNISHRPDSLLGIYYLWEDKAPLKSYLRQKYSNDTITNPLKQWASVAPLYGQYGLHLIKEYPTAYFNYFITPNFVRYYAPDTEFLGIENMGIDTVEEIAKNWFLLKENKIPSRFATKQIFLTEVFTPLFPVINILFVLGLISYFLLEGSKKTSRFFKRLLVLMFVTWLINFFFSITASPVVMRYVIFPLLLTSVFSVLLLAFLIRESKTTQQAVSSFPYDPQIS